MLDKSGPRPDSMTSKERVLAAAKGLPTDRIPVMYWLNPHTVCRLIAEFEPTRNRIWNQAGPYFWRKYINGGGINAKERWRALPQTAYLHGMGPYALELGADLANVPYGTTSFWGKLYRENGRLRIKDALGTVRGMCGIYLEVVKPAIGNIDDVKNYRFPDVSEDKHYAAIKKFRAASPGACIFTDNFGVQDVFATWLWDTQSYLLALMRHPQEMHDFKRRLNDWQIDVARRSVAAGSDIIMIYDDYGHSTNTFLSPAMWREFVFPHLKKKIEAIHDAGALAMLHCCGHQMSLLDAYVEAELDILQAFQPGANNDFAAAVDRVGDRLCIATGVDIQRGETMSPGDLRQDILTHYRIGQKTGRHILATTHLMQPTMPEANYRTIFKTVREIQQGRHEA